MSDDKNAAGRRLALVDGMYVDGDGNRWTALVYPREEAERMSATMVDCVRCKNCHDCQACMECYESTGCSWSKRLADCHGCDNCGGCAHCWDCVRCVNCLDCRSRVGCRGVCFDRIDEDARKEEGHEQDD